MTSDETINLLKTIAESIDRLASFKGKEEDEKGDTIKNEDDKLSSTLSTTEKRRWQTMSKILAKSIKEIVFPEKEEKVDRPEFKSKQVEDMVISPTFSKIQDKSNKWLTMILAALALVGGVIAGVIAELIKIFKGIKAFISETKLGKLVEMIFDGLKAKFLEILKPLRETKIGKFVETVLGEKIIKPLSKLFENVGRIFRIVEGGKGPLLMATKFPTFFKFFEKSIRTIFKVFRFGIKLGRLFGKLLGPLMAVFEVVVGLVQAFTDPKLSDKSFLQKIVTGLTQGLLNFFDFFEIFGLDLFNFDTIRDRIEAIFKPFREGKWLEGLGQILNQLISISLATAGKFVGWIVGWFSKDLGAKITKFWDRFDWFKYLGAIFKRVGKVFGVIKNIFHSISEKLGPFLGPVVKFLFKGSPLYLAFQLMKKAFEYAIPLMKWIGGLVSKVFSGIKKFFILIWDSIKWAASKIGSIISKIPGMSELANELKAIASESQVSEMPAPAPKESSTAATISDTEGNETTPGSNAQNLFDNISESTANSQKEAFSKFGDVISSQEGNTREAFSAFGDQVENLNKTGSVNNKIAVDQLREFKILNQKFDMLMEQLANGRNVINNVVTQNSVNSFPQSTSVFDLRNAQKGAY